MEITQGTLTGLFTNFITTFDEAYEETPVWMDKIATTEPSGTAQNLYAWMQIMPGLREWLGPRKVNALATYTNTVVNKLYEDTFSIDKIRVKDDQYGMYTPMMKLFAMRARKWPDYTLASFIQTLTTLSGYDGTNFFSTTHPVNLYDPTQLSPSGSKNQSNYFTSTPLTPDNFAAVWQAMMSTVDEGGKPFGAFTGKRLLVVPPQLNMIAMNILNTTSIAPSSVGGNTQVGANDNVLKGAADILMIPELANQPTTWYLLDIDKPIKPFIWQLREAPVLTPRVSPTDPNVFDLHQYVFGLEARGAPAVSLWWLAACASA